MLFKAFGLCSLSLDWDKWDIRDTIWDTVCNPRSMVTERHIGPFVTLGG